MLSAARTGALLCILLMVMSVGCTRKHYLIRADKETYAVLGDKVAGTPWEPQPGYTISPHPASRFFDPTPPEDPLLPAPAPQLYAYDLPPMPQRDVTRFRPRTTARPAPADETTGEEQELPGPVRAAALQGESKPLSSRSEEEPDDETLRIKPVAKDVWETLPPHCLRRMLEFHSIRAEYRDSFDQFPAEGLRDAAPRLALEDLMQLALINSRAYQTQKEALYSAALALTFERYQFSLKFTPFGNGTDLEYIHNRTAGITTNFLDIRSQLEADKILATGGTFLARLANSVLLTFNGPEGFAADIQSELFFELSQSLFQRDIVFEALTQAERNVVYAAREYARFRKTFFRDVAAEYYTLLNTYRNIEIAAQDYFSNLRAFAQLEAEFRVGRRSRIEVDQIEQRALSSRSNLIATCNALESALDNLKLTIGLPPELPVNLDLGELEAITLLDEATIAVELVRRAARNLGDERQEKTPDPASVLNFSIELTRRLINVIDLRKQLGGPDQGRAVLEDRLAAMLVDEAEATVAFNRTILAERKKAKPSAPPELIFGRTLALIDALQTLIGRQLNLAERQQADVEALAAVRQQRGQLSQRRELLRGQMDQAVKDRQLERIPQLVESAEHVLALADTVAAAAAKLLQRPPLTPEQQLQRTLKIADALLADSRQVAATEDFGLPAIAMDMDAAMLTALTQRFDLMNERGAQADEWRFIKLAADDLKSVLNLKATQIIRTDSRANKPLDFTFDDSETRLRVEFDAPLNRKAQRNIFRTALINYNAALRSVIELEDTIKIAVRNDLRALELDREQFRIAVAGAALAYERVLSTRLQLQLGKQGVSARDFVEAQQAYSSSLSNVASQHIGYLQDRIDLFVDLELIEIDADGFWPHLYDAQHQPQPCVIAPDYPPYGLLPSKVIYSHRVKRMREVPPGVPTVFQPDSGTAPPAVVDPPIPELHAPREAEPPTPLFRPRVLTPKADR